MAKIDQRLIHQVHRTQGMVKSGMEGTWIYEVRHAQLLDPTKSLKIGVIYNVVNKFVWNTNKPV